MGKKAVAPQIFGGPRPPNLRPPKSKGAHFQSCVKVQGDRPSHLGGIAPQSATKKKPQQNISPPGTTVPGGLNSCYKKTIAVVDGAIVSSIAMCSVT